VSRILPLSGVLGQPSAVALLRSLAERSDPVPPMLFYGPEGIGKRTAALAFAGALACPRREGTDACGRCGPCQRLAEAEAVTALREGSTAQEAPRSYPDSGLVSIPRGKTRISVLQARDIAQSLSLQPFELPRRIYIVDPADAMTLAAANALLKVLEEPPPYGVLILVTSAPWALPVTVRSRLRAVRFGPLGEETVARLLTEEGLDSRDAAQRARRSGGSLAQARRLDIEEQEKRLEAWLQIVEKLAERRPAGPLAVLAGEAFGGSTEQAIEGLEALLAILRDLAAAHTGSAPRTIDPAAAARLSPSTPRLLGPALDRADSIERLRHELTSIHRNPRLAVEGAVLALSPLVRP
jgi:DNA polymerase-3 subunit delta'